MGDSSSARLVAPSMIGAALGAFCFDSRVTQGIFKHLMHACGEGHVRGQRQ
jgi:hypothetical protein